MGLGQACTENRPCSVPRHAAEDPQGIGAARLLRQDGAMFDGVSEEDDPDAALRALLARQLDRVASMMVEGDDGPRWAAVMLCRCLSLLGTTRCATGRPTSALSAFASTCCGAACSAAGVHTPILVASSAAGNQMKAIEEVFAAFG